jgi:parallel beta-helix repeat protein
MKIKASALALTFALLFSTVVGTQLVNFAFTQPVENITINNDGSVTPSSAPVTISGNVYTLNRNILGSITIQKSYVIFDGAGYAINSSSSFAALTLKPPVPLYGEYILNVTIRNVGIVDGSKGILMQSANNSIIANNTISNVETGIMIDSYGTGNTIAGNNLTDINGNGVWVWTSNNTIIANYITACSGSGIYFSDWAGNTVTGNHIEDNQIAINCWAGNPIPEGLQNRIYYNNFVNNTWDFLNQAIFKEEKSSELLYPALLNVWDNGNLGNYWSDYNGNDADGDGVGDTPYFIDDHYPLEGANDTDNYPLMNPIEIVTPSLPTPAPTSTPTPTPTPQTTPAHTPTLPFNGVEYTNGTIIPEHSPLLIWYDWVNISGTQVINYAIYTTSDYNYPVPIANLLGQHFRIADDTQVFIASALSELEVYRHPSDNDLQTNNTSGDREILYYMYTNMSESYSMTPIEKVIEDQIPHYRWSFTYENAYGYLQNATARVGVVASLILSHITLSYDFSVNGNVSNLKTNFDIGKVTSLTIHDNSQFSLEGLSLALLYATATFTSKPYTTYVDGEEFNSATADNSIVDAELAQVEVGDAQTYEFVFGGNYTLNRGETNETAQANIETYEAKAEAVALSSVSPIIRVSPVRGMDFFRDQLNLAEFFGGSWQDFNIDYESSSLIYRICFPVWDGMQVELDPVYIGYILSSTENADFPTPSPEPTPIAEPFPARLVIGSAVAVASIVAIGLLVYFKKRKKDSL